MTKKITTKRLGSNIVTKKIAIKRLGRRIVIKRECYREEVSNIYLVVACNLGIVLIVVLHYEWYS